MPQISRVQPYPYISDSDTIVVRLLVEILSYSRLLDIPNRSHSPYEDLLQHFKLAPAERPVYLPTLIKVIVDRWEEGTLTVQDLGAMEKASFMLRGSGDS